MLTKDNVSTLNTYYSHTTNTNYENSLIDEYLGITTEDDFLTQLSSDLDIPLLLNPDEDELGVLHSFLDKEPQLTRTNNHDSLLQAQSLFDSSQSVCQGNRKEFIVINPVKSESPTPSNSSDASYEIKEEIVIETPPISPNSYDGILLHDQSSSDSCSFRSDYSYEAASRNGKIARTTETSKNAAPYAIPAAKNKRKLVSFPNITPQPVATPPSVNNTVNNVIIIDSLQKLSTFGSITPVQSITAKPTQCISMPQTIFVRSETAMTIPPGVDARVYKKQQRMIKNRESATLSRKKKKEYMTALERQVFDLQEENKQLKWENAQLKERLSQFCNKVASPLMSNIQGKTLKKGIILCAFLFTVGVNLEFIRNPFNKNSVGPLTSEELSNVPRYHGRNLLWVNNSIETPANKTTPNVGLPICPMYVNQSESVRLALELHRWIGEPYKDNTTVSNTQPAKHLRNKQQDSRYLDPPSSVDLSAVYPDTSSYLSNEKRPSNAKPNRRPARRLPSAPASNDNTNNDLQVFAPTLEQLYSEFFEAINRRDDTFYVVSFNPDHLLLPALHHNNTRRPRMSLLLPSMLTNETNEPSYLSLMQIDCEVVDTGLLHINYGVIPQQHRHSNATTPTTTDDSATAPVAANVSTNGAKPLPVAAKPYKPYFVRPRK